MGQREIDNMLLSMIQKHFPALPLSDEYTDWGKWLGFARAAYEAGRASPASASVTAPDYRIADRGFRWDAETRQHIPQLLIEFTPVPANAPNDSNGWKDRDKLAEMLAAAPTPPGSEGADPVMTKEELIAAAESIEMLFTGATIPPVSEDRKDAERYLWLRASDFDIFGSPHAIHLSGKELDQAIDAAMQEDKP